MLYSHRGCQDLVTCNGYFPKVCISLNFHSSTLISKSKPSLFYPKEHDLCIGKWHLSPCLLCYSSLAILPFTDWLDNIQLVLVKVISCFRQSTVTDCGHVRLSRTAGSPDTCHRDSQTARDSGQVSPCSFCKLAQTFCPGPVLTSDLITFNSLLKWSCWNR